MAASDLFLIAHKVRGEPAFDVACRMGCPECCAAPEEAWGLGCSECDALGYWWIIPTSGHRAYPIMYWKLSKLGQYTLSSAFFSVLDEAGPLTEHPDWAQASDHYAHRAAPKVSLIEALGIRPATPQPAAPFPRRL
jgi:hypothetical protein